MFIYNRLLYPQNPHNGTPTKCRFYHFEHFEEQLTAWPTTWLHTRRGKTGQSSIIQQLHTTAMHTKLSKCCPGLEERARHLYRLTNQRTLPETVTVLQKKDIHFTKHQNWLPSRRSFPTYKLIKTKHTSKHNKSRQAQS